jgi:hypothetical protein
MPKVWLPDIEPEASNTIMASSLHGAGFFSSAAVAGVLASNPAKAMIAK